MLVDELRRRDIPFIHPIDEFLEAKEYEQIYNKKYDAGHWNEHGAFIGHSLITKKLKEYFPDVNLLSKNDYNIGMIKTTSLHVSQFKIDEAVPFYTLKQPKNKNVIQTKTVVKKRILIFRDSYFGSIMKYYSGNFTAIKAMKMDEFSELERVVDRYRPDVVLIENAERAINAWYNQVPQ